MAGTTLSETIYQELYQDITEQRLVCGQKLTLQMLRERFHVSQTPIREALVRLSEVGLVTYYSNCGVTVTEFEESDICDLYRFAAELDSMAIRFCENSFNHMPLLMDLEEVIETGNRLLAEGKEREWRACSEQFHTVFYRHAQNRYLDEASRSLRAKIDVLSSMYYQENTIEKIHQGHLDIYEEVRAGRYKEAAARMNEHLQYSMAFALKAYARHHGDRAPASREN